MPPRRSRPDGTKVTLLRPPRLALLLEALPPLRRVAQPRTRVCPAPRAVTALPEEGARRGLWRRPVWGRARAGSRAALPERMGSPAPGPLSFGSVVRRPGEAVVGGHETPSPARSPRRGITPRSRAPRSDWRRPLLPPGMASLGRVCAAGCLELAHVGGRWRPVVHVALGWLAMCCTQATGACVTFPAGLLKEAVCGT